MNTDTRTVTSPGYPTTYTQRNLQCNWKIEEPAGKKLQLVFPVPVSLYRSDTLTVSYVTIIHRQFSLYLGSVVQLLNDLNFFFLSDF